MTYSASFILACDLYHAEKIEEALIHVRVAEKEDGSKFSVISLLSLILIRLGRLEEGQAEFFRFERMIDAYLARNVGFAAAGEYAIDWLKWLGDSFWTYAYNPPRFQFDSQVMRKVIKIMLGLQFILGLPAACFIGIHEKQRNLFDGQQSSGFDTVAP